MSTPYNHIPIYLNLYTVSLDMCIIPQPYKTSFFSRLWKLVGICHWWLMLLNHRDELTVTSRSLTRSNTVLSRMEMAHGVGGACRYSTVQGLVQVIDKL